MKKIILSVTAIIIGVCFALGAKASADAAEHQPAIAASKTGSAIIGIDSTAPKNKPPGAALSSREAAQWVTAWTAAPDSPGPSLKAQTIRQILRTSVAGSSVRIRLSNLFGTAPVTFGSVRVAKHESSSVIKRGTARIVTFGGKSTVTIAQGTDILSDPVALPLTALEQIAVSFYLPKGAATSTIHSTAIQTAFIASGDAAAETVFPKGEIDNSRYFLTDVEAAAEPGARTFVVVGDSVTDGVGSTENENARWTDALAERLQANPASAHIAVANSGISGNRILNDGTEPYLGPSALKRFDRDALAKPGVRWILLLSGGNDISAPFVLGSPKEEVSAEQIIEGMKTLIARARQKGIKIIGATLLPKGGSKFFFEEGEIKRQQVNSWIRTGKAFDAFVDFDKLLLDPALPQRMLPAYDSGDHIHPNNAGYRKMAGSIDLGLFAAKK